MSAPPPPSAWMVRAPWIAATLVLVATSVLLTRPDIALGQQPAFLPGFFTLVAACELLTAIVLVEHYRSGGGPRSLALSWAYVWSGSVVVVHAAVFPGVLTDNGLFGAGPSSAPWSWMAWHTGLPLLLGLALAPWPHRFASWLENPEHRTRRILASHCVVIASVSAVALMVTEFSSRLPEIIVGADYTKLTVTYGPWIALLNLVAVGAAMWGVLSRRRTREIETWALVAIVATACDACLALQAKTRFTTGWYGARAMALTAAVVVLVAMLLESNRLYRRVTLFAQELTDRNAELTEAQSMRDHLIAVVSHDMRTPLTGLRGYLESWQTDARSNGTEAADALTTREAHTVERCLLLTRRLTLLTEDLLTSASAHEGGLSVLPELLDARTQVEDCVASFPGVDIKISSTVGVTVLADPLRLQQIFTNLVSNAVRYGAEPVRIDIGVEGDQAVVLVGDAGHGIDEEFLPMLFDRYSRAPGTQPHGSGLGLSVVRELVRLHGGDVTYLPASNQFRVALPSTLVEAPRGEGSTDRAEEVALPGDAGLTR